MGFFSFDLCLVLALTTFYTVHSFALPFEGLYDLDIIHYNDFHARFEETSVAFPTCRFNNNSCLGGFPRLYHEIQVLLKEKPDALLLNAGDSFQGTYWYTFLKWNITQEFMNMLPHDAHAIGNHEFDDGPEGLAPYLSALKAPVLAANMDTTNEPSLQGLYKPHIIVERKGRKIGIIGLITTDTAKLSSPGNVVFTDPGEATRREAQALTDQGVDIIVLLSHCGLIIDKQLAKDYGEYIDVIIGGHTHSLLWNGPSPSGEFVAGPYPVFIENTASGRQVLIVQASAFTKYMGNLTVSFDYLGHYHNWVGGPIFLNRSIAEDQDIKAKLEPYAKLVHEAENVKIGESDVFMNFEDCAFGECLIGDVLVDALNEYGKEHVNSTHDFLSFIQRGNIKASIPKGTVTQGMLFELLPFNDKIQSFEIQGQYLLEALERSVNDAWAFHPFKGPWLLQVSGLKVQYNVSKPEGQRITSVLVESSAAPLTANKTYQVTVPAYLADGGDGFSILALDPLRNPFYYAQDRESRHAEVAPTACEENQHQQTEGRKLKKRSKSTSLKNTSFIIHKEPGHIRRVIKIIIKDLDGRNTDDIDTEPDCASVDVQYLVRSEYDDIASETEHLISKIVKKFSPILYS